MTPPRRTAATTSSSAPGRAYQPRRMRASVPWRVSRRMLRWDSPADRRARVVTTPPRRSSGCSSSRISMSTVIGAFHVFRHSGGELWTTGDDAAHVPVDSRYPGQVPGGTATPVVVVGCRWCRTVLGDARGRTVARWQCGADPPGSDPHPARAPAGATLRSGGRAVQRRTRAPTRPTGWAREPDEQGLRGTRPCRHRDAMWHETVGGWRDQGAGGQPCHIASGGAPVMRRR